MEITKPNTPRVKRRRRWTLNRSLAVASVLTPLAVIYVGGRIADSSAQRAANVELVKLAVGILQAVPSDSTRGLRRWAVDVLGRYSDVSLPPELKGSLTDSLRLPLGVSGAAEITVLRPGTTLITACAGGVCGTVPLTVRDTARH